MGKKAVDKLVPEVVAFCRLFATLERDLVCCGDVTVPQCVLLQTLREGVWDVSSLAAHMGVTKGATTRLVDGVESRGWLRRVQDQEDRRRFVIALTPDGEAMAERLSQETARIVEVVLGRIPARDRADVIKSMKLLRVAAEESRAEFEGACR